MVHDVLAEISRVDGPGGGAVEAEVEEVVVAVVQVAVQEGQEAASVWAEWTTCEDLNVEAAPDRVWSQRR